MTWKAIAQVALTVVMSGVFLGMWLFVGGLAYLCFMDIWKW